MNATVLSIILGVVGVAVGIIIGKIIFAKDTRRQVEDAEKKLADAEHQAQRINADAISKADSLKREKLLEAKEKFVQMQADHDKQVNDRNRKIAESEAKARSLEQSVTTKNANLDKQAKENDVIKEALNKQMEIVNIKRGELEKHQEEHIRRLEKIAGLTTEEAKAQLIETFTESAHAQALGMQQE